MSEVEEALKRVTGRQATIARKLAERPVGLHRVTLVLAAVVAFGALCVNAGYELAGAGRPFWVTRVGDLEGIARPLAAVLSVPAGWMVFALPVPSALYGMKVGWAAASDAMAERRDRAVGWCIVSICVVGCVACAVMLAKLT